MIKRSAIALAIIVAFAALGACGKKGMPGAPEGSTYPQTYPRP
jgi:predicted small lipoprotein YifL